MTISVQSAEVINPYRIIGASFERPSLDSNAILRLSQKVGAERVEDYKNLQFRIKDGIEATYRFGFHIDSMNVDSGKGVSVISHGKPEYWRYNKPGKLYLYKAGNYNMYAITEHLAVDNFLTSAYFYETGEADYNDDQFFRPEIKSNKEFWKRNLISQGYGAQYIYSNNPFGRNGWLPIGFGYGIDLLCGFLIVAGPIAAPDIQSKVGMPLAGISTSLFFKWLLNGVVAKGHMNTFNRFVNSGYQLPRHNGWNFGNRFEKYSRDSVYVKNVN